MFKMNDRAISFLQNTCETAKSDAFLQEYIPGKEENLQAIENSENLINTGIKSIFNQVACVFLVQAA